MMDKDVENVCKVCHSCQFTSSCDPLDLMSCVLPPSAPWQDCNAHLVGPKPQMNAGPFVTINRAYYNKPGQAFIISRSLTLVYYDKGSAHRDRKDFDNLPVCNSKKLISHNVYVALQFYLWYSLFLN